MVLPYRASCDAMEELIRRNSANLKNLKDYEIINISGVDNPNRYSNNDLVKARIKECEEDGKKTLTLTVNHMLTGTPVPEWDTMTYLKDTASPQEYDQAIFRLQSKYVKEFGTDDNNNGENSKSENDKESGEIIKCNMKPQTLLVDFDPERMYVMEEQRARTKKPKKIKAEKAIYSNVLQSRWRLLLFL